jgi:predicted RNase H-like HicB family nuclease
MLQTTGDRYTALVPMLPGCVSEGYSREEALSRIRQVIADHLRRTEIVLVDVPEPGHDAGNPWVDTFGRSADDPDFEAVQAEIAAYRQAREGT